MPVIITTSRTDEIDIVLGLEGHGADDYVTKPLSPRELIARIRAVLRRTTKQPNANVSRFVINTDLAQITYDNEAISLTRAEYSLLKYLIDSPEQIFTKDELLDAIWGQVHSSDPSTITTHIKAIRQKLADANATSEHIQTHRGLGYSLSL
jgi:two-component system catabolic regulation response regulator CreB